MSGRRHLASVLGLAVAAVLRGLPGRALAPGCAMCQTALDGQSDPLTYAIGVSVLFMMAMPYAIVGTVGVWIYWSARRTQAPTLDSVTATPSDSWIDRRLPQTEGELS